MDVRPTHLILALAPLTAGLAAQDYTIRVAGETLTLGVDQARGVGLVDLVRITQTITHCGAKFDPRDTADTRIVFEKVELPTASFYRFFQAMIYRAGFDCTRDAGKDLITIRRRTATDWRITPERRVVYTADGRATPTPLLHLTSVPLRSAPQGEVAEQLGKLAPRGVQIGLPADGSCILLQGPGADVATARRVVSHLDVPAESPAEKVAGGFGFVEGPAWDPRSRRLLFSDIPNDRILELGKDDEVATFLSPSARANGLAFDAAGNLFACQGGARRVVRIAPDGGTTVLASSFEGKRLNSPNDLALDAHGGLYFTDPRYGKADDVEQDVMGVYYVARSGTVTRVIDSLQRPNGVVISADGRQLYVAEPDKREIRVFEVRGPGEVGPGRMLFRSVQELDGGGPDGMALDGAGNLYATYRSLLVLSPKGELLRRIPVAEKPSNCTFGGARGGTLYITARTGLYRVGPRIRTHPEAATWVTREAIGAAELELPAAEILQRVLAEAFGKDWQPLLDGRLGAGRAAAWLASVARTCGPRTALVVEPIRLTDEHKRVFPVRSNGKCLQWAFVFEAKERGRGVALAPFTELAETLDRQRRSVGATNAFRLDLGGKNYAYEFAMPWMPDTGCLAVATFGEHAAVGNSGTFLRRLVRVHGGAEARPERLLKQAAPGRGAVWIDRAALPARLREVGAKIPVEVLEQGDLAPWLRLITGG